MTAGDVEFNTVGGHRPPLQFFRSL